MVEEQRSTARWWVPFWLVPLVLTLAAFVYDWHSFAKFLTVITTVSGFIQQLSIWSDLQRSKQKLADLEAPLEEDGAG